MEQLIRLSIVTTLAFYGCASADTPPLPQDNSREPQSPTQPDPRASNQDHADAGDTETSDGGDTGIDSDVAPAACVDRLPAAGVVQGPQGLMIQLPTIGDRCELERALDHVCNEHPEIQDLVITSTEVHQNGVLTADFDEERMSWIAPYLGCFPNVFVGTMSETFLSDPYAAATVLDEDERWRWIDAARAVATEAAAWMDANVGGGWHWYVSYEANLNVFTDTDYRNAYVALLQQHILELEALNDGVIAWSPTFWTRPSDLDATGRAALEGALTTLFDRVPVDWVLVQDHVGANPASGCSDAVAYYEMVRSAGSTLSSVQINVEYFTTTGGLQAGDPTELAARTQCYLDAGVSLGSSFEIRYWYGAHGH